MRLQGKMSTQIDKYEMYETESEICQGRGRMIQKARQTGKICVDIDIIYRKDLYILFVTYEILCSYHHTFLHSVSVIFFSICAYLMFINHICFFYYPIQSINWLTCQRSIPFSTQRTYEGPAISPPMCTSNSSGRGGL